MIVSPSLHFKLLQWISWLKWWNNLHGPGRTESTFVFPFAWLSRFYSSSIQCEVIISPSSPVTIYFDGDGRSSFYLDWIDGTISLDLDEQTVRLYSCVLDSDHVIGVWSSAITWSLSVKIYYTGDDRRLIVLVESMERPRRHCTHRWYVSFLAGLPWVLLFGFDPIIPPFLPFHNILPLRWSL